MVMERKKKIKNCGVKKYRKKQLIVEAVKNTGDNVSEIREFMVGKSRPVCAKDGYVYLIDTLEGTMTAKVGDYIIKGVKGEFYPCKPEVFEATYDECSDQRDGEHTQKQSGIKTNDMFMTKKCRSITRAVQHNGKNFKEINNFIKEITGGRYYVRKHYSSLWIVNASNNLGVDTCHLNDYIVAGKDLKYKVLSSDVFESLFVFYDEND